MRFKKQLGFVLSEVVIAISLVVILLGTTVQLYDTNRSRAELLHQKMSDVASGLLRMKTDANCFPSKLSGMVNPTDATDTFCGPTTSDTWKGPYTAVGTRFGTAGANAKDMLLEQITPSLEVFLEERVLSANTNGAGLPSNEKKAWILSTRNLTPEIQTLFLDFCSKAATATGTLPNARCFSQAGNQVGFLVDANEGWENYYNGIRTPGVIADICKGASCVTVNNNNPVTTTPTYCTVGVNCPVSPPGVCPDGSAPIAGTCPVPPVTKFCPNGTIMPASGICPATPTYCPDGITVMPASGICPPVKPPCAVGVDPKCPLPSTITSSSGFSGSSSSSSGSMGGYRGSDGQVYPSPLSGPGDEPCGSCRVVGDTNEAKASWDSMKNASLAASIGSSISSAISSAFSSIGSALSSIGSAIGSFFSSVASFFSSAFSGDDDDDDSSGDDSSGDDSGGDDSGGDDSSSSSSSSSSSD